MGVLIRLVLPLLLALPASLAAQAGRGPAGQPASSSAELEELYWAERTLEGLTLRQRVAQLVFPYIEGGRPREGGRSWDRAVSLAREQAVGGFIVGAGPASGTASFLNVLQSQADVPLLAAADLEWGPGTRLEGATLLPVNMALAAAGPPALAREAGRITALEARAAGVHMAFAPVADVNNNPLNPVINTRSYGSDPVAVAERVAAFVAGAREAGLLTVAKHFPGHGDTDTDSHVAMPVVPLSRARLDTLELVPFRAAIAAGVDGVMSAHLAVPALEDGRPRPATLSFAVMTGLLRDELSFAGLVVTDALHMDAVTRRGSPGEVAVSAIRAGADILLQPPEPEEVIDAVVAAVERGAIPRSRIDRSVRRVLAAKAAAGLPAARYVELDALDDLLGHEAHRAWGRAAFERSLTLVRAPATLLPLRLAGRHVLSIRYDASSRRAVGDDFDAALAARGAVVERVRLHRHSGRRDIDAARRMAAGADLVLFSSYARAAPWRNRLALPDDVAALADRLAADGALILSFGDPYLLRQVPAAGTYLLAWTHETEAQRAAARALAGEIAVAGRLPIALPDGGHAPGEGVRLPATPRPEVVGPARSRPARARARPELRR